MFESFLVCFYFLPGFFLLLPFFHLFSFRCVFSVVSLMAIPNDECQRNFAGLKMCARSLNIYCCRLLLRPQNCDVPFQVDGPTKSDDGNGEMGHCMSCGVFVFPFYIYDIKLIHNFR